MKYFEKYSPQTNELLYKVPISDDKIVEEVCQKAQVAFLKWKKSTIRERKSVLTQLLENIKNNQARIAECIMLDTGKAQYEAVTEVIESCDMIEFFCSEDYSDIENGKRVKLNEEVWAEKEGYVVYQPCGVYAVIKPWNYPFELSIWAIVPLVLSGNTIVYKPSELSNATGMLLADLINTTEIPDGVFNVLTGDARTGELLVKNRNIKGISFTGSTKTGKEIFSKGRIEQKMSLEMGGSDYAIVRKDADWNLTISGLLWGAFTNAGQVCVSVEKIMVANDIYKEFIEQFVKKTLQLTMGKDIAPIISVAQLKKAEYIIQTALEHGCRILCGGKRFRERGFEQGNYMMPTVIECRNVDFLKRIPEVFAPIVFVTPFMNEEEALEIISTSSYGLGCSIWTANPKECRTLIQDIDVGMVWINEVNLPMPQLPWVGRKESAIGVNLSKQCVYDAMNMKIIHVDKSNMVRDWWYPYLEER